MTWIFNAQKVGIQQVSCAKCKKLLCFLQEKVFSIKIIAQTANLPYLTDCLTKTKRKCISLTFFIARKKNTLKQTSRHSVSINKLTVSVCVRRLNNVTRVLRVWMALRVYNVEHCRCMDNTFKTLLQLYLSHKFLLRLRRCFLCVAYIEMESTTYMWVSCLLQTF